MPNLAQVSPRSLGHLTKYIETVSVGPIPWTEKEVRVIKRKLWSHHQSRDRGDDGEGNRFVVSSPR